MIKNQLVRLIGQSKLPEGDDVAIACFDVVFDNVALGCILPVGLQSG